MTDCTKCWWHGKPIDCPAAFNFDTKECKGFEPMQSFEKETSDTDNNTIEQIFKEIKEFIEHRYSATETLANKNSDNEDYYAGCGDAYLRVGAYISELQKKHNKSGKEENK